MNLRTIKIAGNVDAIVASEYYSMDELELIMKEINFLEPKLGDESKTNAAVEKTAFGERRKKRGRGVFLDDVFTDRRFSSILMLSRKLFRENIRKEITTLAENGNIYWQQWEHTNWDSTILQTYENGDYYDSHCDKSVFTSITTLKFSDNISGGDLEFTSPKGEKTLFMGKHNSMILFPSVLDHKVTEVIIPQDKRGSIFNNRWSISHLVSMRP